MQVPQIGLNRFDWRSPLTFAQDVARAEQLGWNWALIPASSMKIQDPYVNLAFAAQSTQRIGLGVLLDNPIVRHPAVLASSMATVERLAPGRTLLTLGVGDTAVRLIGAKPAKVDRLEAATTLTKLLMTGDPVDVGVSRPARMEFPANSPVWIAAGGPRTLRMAGRVADGVFIRVGTHSANLTEAYEHVLAGIAQAGRSPEDVRIGLIFHVVLDDDRERAALMARSMAAGYYEYSPMLFDAPGFEWNGPPCEELKQHVWPDFHHHPNLVESGKLVEFLSDDVANAFAIHGNANDVAAQLITALNQGVPCDVLVPHPMPTPRWDAPRPDYMERFASEVLPLLHAAP
jgi:5,10-methylenetetrahydromethanopterin reductase